MTLKNMIELADGLTPIETEIGYYILKNFVVFFVLFVFVFV